VAGQAPGIPLDEATAARAANNSIGVAHRGSRQVLANVRILGRTYPAGLAPRFTITGKDRAMLTHEPRWHCEASGVANDRRQQAPS
jgi:hypothetical protein